MTDCAPACLAAARTPASARSTKTTPVDALEFFSGIGGLHFGLCAAQRTARAKGTADHLRPQKRRCDEVAEVPSSGPAAAPKLATPPQGWATRSLTVQPFEIHDVANQVYDHNFREHDGYRQPSTQDIRSLTAAQLDAHRAWLWLLSPPCQPYTRLGKRRDHKDSRAAALLHLISLLPKLSHPPTHLMLENVVGFETSETAQRLRHVLSSLGYDWREYHISPTDLGLPNQRLRYFLLARQARGQASPDAGHANLNYTGSEGKVCPPVRYVPHSWNESHPKTMRSGPIPLSYFLDEDGDHDSELLVSASMLERYGHLLDVRVRGDSHCLCFTKNYTRSATGAVPATCTQPAHTRHKLLSNMPHTVFLYISSERYLVFIRTGFCTRNCGSSCSPSF